MEHSEETTVVKQSFVKSRKGFIFALATFLILVAGGGGLYYGMSKRVAKPEAVAVAVPEVEKSVTEAAAAPEAEAATAVTEQSPGFFGQFIDAFQSVQVKVDELARASEENERLRLENENLRQQLSANEFEHAAKTAERHTASTAQRLSQETWQAAGRKLDTIQYQIPAHLLPSQLYTLGVSYLRNGEIEKAAKIFTHLTSMEGEEAYHTARQFLLTGVAWYRLDHLQLADAFFDQVLKFGDEKNQLPYKAQARLWRALVAQRIHQHKKSQDWLLELVDHHPHSPEAGWVNSKEVNRARVPASQAKAEDHDASH